eukprot:363970-Chlamydomonas_euryale.AAC.8
MAGMAPVEMLSGGGQASAGMAGMAPVEMLAESSRGVGWHGTARMPPVSWRAQRLPSAMNSASAHLFWRIVYMHDVISHRLQILSPHNQLGVSHRRSLSLNISISPCPFLPHYAAAACLQPFILHQRIVSYLNVGPHLTVASVAPLGRVSAGHHLRASRHSLGLGLSRHYLLSIAAGQEVCCKADKWDVPVLGRCILQQHRLPHRVQTRINNERCVRASHVAVRVGQCRDMLILGRCSLSRVGAGPLPWTLLNLPLPACPTLPGVSKPHNHHYNTDNRQSVTSSRQDKLSGSK